jgi:hypothetical protein
MFEHRPSAKAALDTTTKQRENPVSVVSALLRIIDPEGEKRGTSGATMLSNTVTANSHRLQGHSGVNKSPFPAS